MPGSMQENPGQRAADIAALVKRLPSVQACRLTEENGQPREIHILADDARSPKQIARDVQSALMAQFGLYVDHRLISIAQIPCAFAEERSAPAASRLICDRLSLSMNKREFEAAVFLTLGEKSGQGSGQGRMAERRQIIGRAAAQAINQFLTEGVCVRVSEVDCAVLDGRRVLLAAVALENPSDTEYLVGAAYENEDADIAVVHAVLDAINRRIRF